MILKFTIKRRPRWLSKRAWQGVTRESFHALGVYWHKYLRKKHFTQTGAREYGYDVRSRKYEALKLRRFGHRDPLVYTGTSKALTAIRDVRSTAKGVRVVMRAPGLNRRARGKRTAMYDEMTMISDRERPELVDVFRKEVNRRLKDMQ